MAGEPSRSNSLSLLESLDLLLLSIALPVNALAQTDQLAAGSSDPMLLPAALTEHGIPLPSLPTPSSATWEAVSGTYSHHFPVRRSLTATHGAGNVNHSLLYVLSISIKDPKNHSQTYLMMSVSPLTSPYSTF